MTECICNATYANTAQRTDIGRAAELVISESMINALVQKWGVLTAIELRHIEQSCEVCGAPPDSPDMVMFRRRLCVVRLEQGG